MSYVQIIEFVTHDPEKMKALGNKYAEDAKGRAKLKRSLVYHDRSESRRYVAILEWENREDSFDDENLPETEEFIEGLEELSDVPLSYRSLELAYTMVR